MNYDQQNGQTGNGYIGNAALANFAGLAPASPLGDDAGVALARANDLHGYLDELETRLFGPEPREASGENAVSQAKPSLLTAVKATKQRLESAGSRLERILSRL